MSTVQLNPENHTVCMHMCMQSQTPFSHITHLSIYIIESVCLFVCLFAVNAKTTARIDAKRSGITKNDPESVLCCLKSPVLVFLGRYRTISGFSFAADRHFLLISLPLLAVA